MPAKTDKQAKFMRAVANSPAFAKKVGVPQSVGREFSKSGGGEMKESKTMMKKEVAFMKKKGAPKSMIKHEKAEAGMEAGGVKKQMPKPDQMGSLGMKKGGKVKKYAKGGGIEVKGKTKGKMVKMAGGGKYC